MKTSLPILFFLTVLTGLHSCESDKNQFQKEVDSPDKSINVTVNLIDNNLCYSVKYNSEIIIENSSLQLELNNSIENGFDVIATSKKSIDNEWHPVYGENSVVKNQYQLLLVKLKEKGSLKRKINIEFRVYNEGIAFRYNLPEQQYRDWNILNELSEFNFIRGSKAYPIEATEHTFSKNPVDIKTIASKVLTPLTIQLENSFASILEANVNNYPRMHLMNSVDSILTSKLLGKANIQAPFSTPWRAVLLAENEGKLIENESLILNLNQPCAIQDISWIQPGRTISNEGNVPLKTKALKKLVDFAAENGFKYVQLDWGWYGTEVKWEKEWIDDYKKMMPEKYKNTDWELNTQANPYTMGKGLVPYGWTERFKNSFTLVDLDMAKLIDYGNSKNVGICLYLEAGSTLPSNNMDSLFATYKKWGVAGLKPGFVKYGKQENTTWIRNMVKTAAKNRLWLCIHDAHVPDGFERTYPNLMISEGGGGQEGNHPVVQDVMLPFTRCLAGAFDYTPFFFSKGKTNAHMLAFMVVYNGSAQIIRGAYPVERDNQKNCGKDDLDVIKKIPSTWDETKVLNAKIGEYITIARKNGDNWYIGSITGDAPQSFEINLDFLDSEKKYKATIYGDDKNAIENGWTPINTIEKMVNKNDTININLATTGGCIIIIEPNKLKNNSDD
jgi:alpha-glucosidase